MSEISITIPYEYDAIRHTADMLDNIAKGLENKPTTAPTPPALEPALEAAGVDQVSDAQTTATTGDLPVTNVDTDIKGLPWDARIHASSRVINANGQWKKRKGIDQATVDTVTAELVALMAIPSPVEGSIDVDNTPGEIIPTPPAETEVESTPPTPPAAMTFPELATKITGAQIPELTVLSAVSVAGLTALPQLVARPDLIPVVHDELFPNG